MAQTKIFLAVLALALFTSVLGRPRAAPSTDQQLISLVQELSHTLNEAVDIIHAERSPGRRRRMVQFHIARNHYIPNNRYRRGRRRNWYQRAARNGDISDH